LVQGRVLAGADALRHVRPGLGLLAFRELRISKPVVDFRPLAERSFAACCIVIFCTYGVLYGASTSLPGLLHSCMATTPIPRGWCSRHRAFSPSSGWWSSAASAGPGRVRMPRRRPAPPAPAPSRSTVGPCARSSALEPGHRPAPARSLRRGRDVPIGPLIHEIQPLGRPGKKDEDMAGQRRHVLFRGGRRANEHRAEADPAQPVARRARPRRERPVQRSDGADKSRLLPWHRLLPHHTAEMMDPSSVLPPEPTPVADSLGQIQDSPVLSNSV